MYSLHWKHIRRLATQALSVFSPTNKGSGGNKKWKSYKSQQKSQPSTFHTRPPRLAAEVSDLGVVVIGKVALLGYRGALQPAYASRGTPEQYQASVQWSGGLETKSPLQRPLYEVSRPVGRQHVYVRLCKAPFASANQRRAGAVRPMRSRRFSHFVCELYKWIYINGFI